MAERENWRDALEEIERLAPPPDKPFDTPVDWPAFEEANGFAPPADFRELIDAYGSGYFLSDLGGLGIDEVSHPDRTFLQGSQFVRDALRGSQVQFPEQSPAWPVYPDVSGWLACGSTDLGWDVGWLTNGPPESWVVAINGNRDGWWAEVPFGIVELVRRWLTGNLGIPEVRPVDPGQTSFQAREAHDYWSGRTCEVSIHFKPTPNAMAFTETPQEKLEAALAPAQLASYGSRGDAQTPVHVTLDLRYRPAEELAVVRAVRAFAQALGTEVASVTALDGTRGWPGSRTR